MDFQISNPSVQSVELTERDEQQQPGEKLADQLTYWKQQLGDAPEALDLPTDHPRLPMQSHITAQYSFELPQQLTTRLKMLSQDNEVSLFIPLLGGLYALLYRYSGQDDLLIAIPSMERTQVKFNDDEDVRRRFVNLLVLRARMSGNPSFRELMERVSEVALEAYAHQDVPFEQVVAAVQHQQNVGNYPPCKVMFVMEETGGRDFSLYPADNGIVKLDLQLTVQDTAQELKVLVEYDTNLFEEATIARMMGHWQMLLKGVITEPEQRLSELPLLTKVERHQLMVEWNDTAADYPGDLCIHQLFEAQVKHTPDAVALVHENMQLTYQQLNQRANRLAHYLQRLGVKPEVSVGLCVERSPEMIVGLLAILKAGGAYVPLDPSYPKERLTFILEDIQAPILVTQKHLGESLPTQSAQVVCIDQDGISQESEENPTSGVRAENAAYIIYTSGTTGTPKGVVIQHRSVVNYTEAARVAYAINPEDRVLQFAAISFDASAEEIYPCLVCGATLVLRTNSMIDSIPMFLQKCQEWALTVLDLPTAYWHEFTRKIAAETLMLPPSVRLVIIGGERVQPEMVALWQSRVGQQVQLMNTYGPTEATIVATMHRILGSKEAGTTPREVPIGRPIANVQVYLLDQYLNIVPIGVPGELHIGGVGLARGYFNRAELTAEKFIPHPFTAEPGAHLYKTGDMVRYLPNGDIEFLGRIDHQVKIRGYRIELGEIEAVLEQHQVIQEAVVVVREDIPGDKRLVAYVVPNRDQTPTRSELRSIVLEFLPDYMVPSAFVLLKSLPLSSNGKLDRRALPAPDWSSREMDETFVAPTLEVQQHLAQIWEELLNTRPIGIRDNFFELGGHSLLAVRLVDQIEQFWGKRISATTLLAGPTIEQLANVLMQSEDISSDVASAKVKTVGIKRPFSSVRRLLTSLVKTTQGI